MRSWWQKIRNSLVVIASTVLLASVLVLLIFTGYKLTWTGFFNKTLWDWLNLLGVLAIPAVVGLGAAWYTAQQGKVSTRENTDNQREAALQAYIDKMSELLLHEKLRGSTEEDEVRKIARVHTLTILPRLDASRKRSVLQFLYESGLIYKDKAIVDLKEADLSGADLHEANLSYANLFRAILKEADLSGATMYGTNLMAANLDKANLSWATLAGATLIDDYDSDKFSPASLREANLSGADLSGADLGSANLSGANLHEANLNGVNLRDAVVTDAQLAKAKFLKDATMPDGSKSP